MKSSYENFPCGSRGLQPWIAGFYPDALRGFRVFLKAFSTLDSKYIIAEFMLPRLANIFFHYLLYSFFGGIIVFFVSIYVDGPKLLMITGGILYGSVACTGLVLLLGSLFYALFARFILGLTDDETEKHFLTWYRPIPILFFYLISLIALTAYLLT